MITTTELSIVCAARYSNFRRYVDSWPLVRVRARTPTYLFCSWHKFYEAIQHLGTSICLFISDYSLHGCSVRLRGGAFCVLALYWESAGHWFESVYGLVYIFASGIYFCETLVFYLVCQSLRKCARLHLRPLGGHGWRWVLMCWLRWRWRWGSGDGNGWVNGRLASPPPTCL